MRRLKLFLASSAELKDDRVAFELFIGRENKSLVDKGLFLDLTIWEDFIDALSADGLQKEYNKAILESDIFVMLYFTKVGKYTAEEFETAIGAFKEGGRPLIYTYFKTAEINTGAINRNDLLSLLDFQDKLKTLGHYYTQYKSAEDLQLKFGQQLDKLADAGFFTLDAKLAAPAQPSTNSNSLNAPPTTNSAAYTPNGGFDTSQAETGTPAKKPVTSPPKYLLPNVHKLLMAAFDAVSLETFALLHFLEVHQQFAPGMVQALRVNALLNHAQRFGKMQDLLAAVQAENPYQYAQYEPYTQS